jgi:hypothetical protein
MEASFVIDVNPRDKRVQPIKFNALRYVTQCTLVYTHKPFGKKIIFYTEDTGISLLRNVGTYSSIYMTFHPGRLQF